MEDGVKHLWTFSLAFATLSTTMTIFIIKWLKEIQAKMHMGEQIQKNLSTLVLSVEEIKVAMIGDYDKKGLITRHHEIEKRLDALEEKSKNG